jgi:hypothetical protein
MADNVATQHVIPAVKKQTCWLPLGKVSFMHVWCRA